MSDARVTYWSTRRRDFEADDALPPGEWVRKGNVLAYVESELPADRDECIAALNAQGKNDREIGDLLGVGRRTVGEIRRRNGIPAVLKPPAASRLAEVDDATVARLIAGDKSIRSTPNERRAAVLVLKARGMSNNEIATALGVTVRTIGRINRKVEVA